MTCKEIARELTTDRLAETSAWHRAQVRLHLWMCEHCGRLDRQLKKIGEAGRRTSQALGREKPAEGPESLEARLTRRLLDE